jgi:hypothetical protein
MAGQHIAKTEPKTKTYNHRDFMAGQHIAKTQKGPVSIQLKKAGQQKASWPVSI